MNAVRRFLLRQNKHLTQPQRDAFSDLAERTIAMESLLESAIREAGEQGVRMDGEARHLISADLDDDLQAVLDGTFNSKNNEVHIGNTSKFLTDVIGIDAHDVTMPPSKAYSAMVTEEQARRDGTYQEGVNYHGLGKQGLIDALNASETPIAAFASLPGEKSKRANRIVLVTDKTISGKNIAVIEELETTGHLNGRRIDANKVITSYDRATIAEDVIQAAADGRLLFVDKKRSQTLAAGTRTSNWYEAIRGVDFSNNIRNFLQNVKWENQDTKNFTSAGTESETIPDWKKRLQEYSDNGETAEAEEPMFSLKEDSEGRELTEAQQEFFHDSKVVDSKGRLRVVYHGTGADFNVFDANRVNQNWGVRGGNLGFYFSPYIEDAREYARYATNHESKGRIIEAYLNLKNPLIVEDDGWGSAIRQADLRQGDLMRWAKEGGHDGIIVKSMDEEMADDEVDTVYIAFSSEQIKNVTNQNPTNNPDIRWSKKGEEEAAEDLRKEQGTSEQENQASAAKITRQIIGKRRRAAFLPPSDCQKSLAEFAPAGAKNGNQRMRRHSR